MSEPETKKVPRLKVGSRWRCDGHNKDRVFEVTGELWHGAPVVRSVDNPTSTFADAPNALFRLASDHDLHATGLYADEPDALDEFRKGYDKGYEAGRASGARDSAEEFRKGYEKGWDAAREADAETVGEDIQPEAAELVPHECRPTFEDFLLAVPRGGTFTYTAPPECPDEEADPC